MSTEARLGEAHAAIVAIHRAKEKQWLGEAGAAEALEAARAAAIEQVDAARDWALHEGIPAAVTVELAAKARAAVNALADARWPEHRAPHAGEVWPALWPLQHAALEACREIVGLASKPLPGSRAAAVAIDNIAQLVPTVIAMRQRLEMLKEADRLRDAAFPDGARPKFYLVPASTAQAERESRAGKQSVLYFIKDGVYRVDDGEHFSIDERGDTVLQAFLDTPAMTQTELVAKSGYQDAARILRRLSTQPQLARFIHLPGRKSRGGFRVEITRT